MKRNIEVLVSISLTWSLIAVSPVHAGDAGYVKEGTYLGASFIHNSMSGDFDDTIVLVGPSGGVDVPDVDNGPGFGVVLGWRGEKVAMELGYQRSIHDTFSSFVDIGESEAAYNVVDLNFKIDVFARNKLRPYILLGLGIPWLTIEDSATAGEGLEDATFFGYCLNAGAGVAYYFRPQLAVTGGLIYRWNRFTSAEGTSLEDSLSEGALGLTVGIAYTF